MLGSIRTMVKNFRATTAMWNGYLSDVAFIWTIKYVEMFNFCSDSIVFRYYLCDIVFDFDVFVIVDIDLNNTRRFRDFGHWSYHVVCPIGDYCKSIGCSAYGHMLCLCPLLYAVYIAKRKTWLIRICNFVTKRRKELSVTLTEHAKRKHSSSFKISLNATFSEQLRDGHCTLGQLISNVFGSQVHTAHVSYPFGVVPHHVLAHELQDNKHSFPVLLIHMMSFQVKIPLCNVRKILPRFFLTLVLLVLRLGSLPAIAGTFVDDLKIHLRIGSTESLASATGLAISRPLIRFSSVLVATLIAKFSEYRGSRTRGPNRSMIPIALSKLNDEVRSSNSVFRFTRSSSNVITGFSCKFKSSVCMLYTSEPSLFRYSQAKPLLLVFDSMLCDSKRMFNGTSAISSCPNKPFTTKVIWIDEVDPLLVDTIAVPPLPDICSGLVSGAGSNNELKSSVESAGYLDILPAIASSAWKSPPHNNTTFNSSSFNNFRAAMDI
ncbi:hypothetical protein Bhyg_09792 [Pseudolycoriella hygida]|uniref:Uncharacterized protein n=1 Tax=Pseudolycoriella hygida TaxID=35572 RepID=A0A9Q0RYE6_9DIPT|nr:hypothetical protein Bhyg_09792 [Pseudolycoriella hygida]